MGSTETAIVTSSSEKNIVPGIQNNDATFGSPETHNTKISCPTESNYLKNGKAPAQAPSPTNASDLLYSTSLKSGQGIGETKISQKKALKNDSKNFLVFKGTLT